MWSSRRKLAERRIAVRLNPVGLWIDRLLARRWAVVVGAWLLVSVFAVAWIVFGVFVESIK